MVEIVGWGIRVPGAETKEEFWSVLQEERCTITTIPEERWSRMRFWHPRLPEPGKSYSFAAGVLDDVWGFDPAVFGISPREAEQLDPQQRMLLEVTWEAIEDSGISPETLAGQPVGVFVGASSLDYSIDSFFDPSIATGHFMTGNTLSIISNRLSYIFDLKGPSFTVDTACSSSLVALNEAVKALNSGTIDTAIVAGVNALLSPIPFVGFAQATMLSPEGLCRAFDARGEGYVRSEGCLSFVLRRGDASPWRGQKSLVRIVDVGINADGKTIGMSLPSHESQASLLRDVYSRSGIDFNDLAFIEAHGTGTRVGDPAEALSIGQSLAKFRVGELPIGSVKTNIGHLEPASGLAGLAKACLALENDLLPASLHCEEPNPDIDFAELNLKIATQAIPLVRTGRPRFAGVNSFGFGGTNAHVLLSDPEEKPVALNAGAGPTSASNAGLLMLSAKSNKALAEMARCYGEIIEESTEDELSELQSAVWYRKKHFEEKLIVKGCKPENVAAALRTFADGKKSETALSAGRSVVAGKCAFVFSGNGTQWPGMGRAAYLNNVDFRSCFDEISQLFVDLAGVSLKELLFSENLKEKLELTSTSQPLIFAVQVSLCSALERFGLRPDFVMGHSIGEAAAAIVSGALSLHDGVRLVFHRSQEQEAVAGAGTMAALVLPEDAARKAIRAAKCDAIEIAAVNSPKSVSLSGTHKDLAVFGKYAREHHLAFRKLDLNYPFHSSLIEAVEKPFKSALGNLKTKNSTIPFISTVMGKVVTGQELNTEYWWLNLKRPVRLEDAISCALEEGARRFIEIGPKPILQSYIRQSIAPKGVETASMGSLSERQSEDADPILDILANALLKGFDGDEQSIFGANPVRALTLPTYPWQNKPYRFDKTSESNADLLHCDGHPLLGWRTNDNSHTWHTHVDVHVLPFLADHAIDGKVIFPAAGYLEIALAVGRAILQEAAIEIRDIAFVQAMFLRDDHLTEIRTEYFPETGTIEISSRRRLSDEEWNLNAKGRVFKAVRSHFSHERPTQIGSDFEPGRITNEEIYQTATSTGLNYGPTFQRASHVERVSTETARVHLITAVPDHPFNVHPAELDSCFHGLFAFFADKLISKNEPRAYIPVHFEKVQFFSNGRQPTHADVTVRRISKESILADFEVFDADGNLHSVISRGRFRAVSFGRRETTSHLVFHCRSEPIESHVRSERRADPSLTPLADLLPGPSTKREEDAVQDQEAESRLLLEAAAQRMAFDLLRDLATRNGGLRVKDFPEEMLFYLRTLLGWMLHIDAARETQSDVYVLEDISDLPEFDLLIEAALQDSAQDIAAVTLLTRCRAVAFDNINRGQAVFEPAQALLDQFRFAAPDSLARLDFLKSWLSPFLKNWPRDKPLRVLDLAGSGLELARHIVSKMPCGLARVAVVDPDPNSGSGLKTANDAPSYIEVFDYSKELQNLKGMTFDLVVSSGRLHEFEDIGTTIRNIAATNQKRLLFAAIEPTESLVADAIYGLMSIGKARRNEASFSISSMKSAREWVSKLRLEAGFDQVEAAQLTFFGHPADVILAESPGQAADTVPSTEFDRAAWIILCDGSPDELTLAEALSNKLATKEVHSEILVSNRQETGTKFASTLKQALEAEAFAGAENRVVFSFFGTKGFEQDDVGAIAHQCLSLTIAAETVSSTPLKFVLLAPGGSGISDSSRQESPIGSAIWAFSRVLSNEFPDLDIRRLDASIEQDPDSFAAVVVTTVAMLQKEQEIIHENEALKALRIVEGFPPGETAPAEAVALDFDHPGSLNSLTWRATERNAPADKEVEIEVAAVGLNFRDVMWTLGMLPDEALEDGYGGPTLGLECSGRIVRVGQEVAHLNVGDPVIAFTRAGFSSHVTVPEYAVAKLDENLDLVDAATVPVAFLTAYYALIELAGLKKDQWFLLHGGAGGVGLAALQIAKNVGARVIATAGTDEKRDLLAALGAEYVLDSRSLDFSETVLKLTEGRGVHVVLNSLAGEAMERSIQLVRPFGRFLELGKRDFYENTKIALRPFRKNVSYFGIDVDQLLSHDLDLASEMIGTVYEQLRSGSIVPLPYRRFEGRNVQEAFRLMQRSAHIGKILVIPPAVQEVEVQKYANPISFDPEGMNVVVGGLGGFGLEIARWLADNGASRIVLTSRSGKVSEAHSELIEKLRERGVEILTLACDVTDVERLSSVLAELRQKAPIKSIIHAAMVLDDGLASAMDEDRFTKVLAPKVQGARLLDQLTLQDDLDHFILFSSLTTMIGNPGQANYVAANGYLEGLARQRRQSGRPGLAVGWGGIKDVGFLARHSDVSKKLSKLLGNAMITAREGLDILAEAMSRDRGDLHEAVIHIGRIDWPSMKQTLPVLKQETFRHIALARGIASGTHTGMDTEDLIAGKSELEAKQIIGGLMAQELSEILRLPAAEIALNRPLADFGMDSLMGLELRMSIEKRFNIEFPLVSLSGGTSIEDFAGRIYKRLGSEDGVEVDEAAEDLIKDELATLHLDANFSTEQKKAVGRLIDQNQKNRVI